MKITDIEVGKTYAVPLTAVGLGRKSYGYRPTTSGTAKDVSEGTLAAPVRVVAVGKFRWQRQGACDKAIVADHFTTTIHVQTIDTADISREQWRDINKVDGMAGSDVPLTSKKLVWRDVLLLPNTLIMPWDSFKTRYDENRLAALEMQAYAEKHAKLVDELKTSVAVTAKKKLKLPLTPTVQFYNGQRDGMTRASVAVTVTTAVPLEDMLTPADKKLHAEILDLEERMKCSPRQRLARS